MVCAIEEIRRKRKKSKVVNKRRGDAGYREINRRRGRLMKRLGSKKWGKSENNRLASDWEHSANKAKV